MKIKYKNSNNQDIKLHFLKWVVDHPHREKPEFRKYLDLMWVGVLKKYGDVFHYEKKELVSINDLEFKNE